MQIPTGEPDNIDGAEQFQLKQLNNLPVTSFDVAKETRNDPVLSRATWTAPIKKGSRGSSVLPFQTRRLRLFKAAFSEGSEL